MFNELLKAFDSQTDNGQKFSIVMQMAVKASTFEELEIVYACAAKMHNGIAKQAVLSSLSHIADNPNCVLAERLAMWEKILRIVPERTSAFYHAQKRIDCLKKTIAQAELQEQRKIDF